MRRKRTWIIVGIVAVIAIAAAAGSSKKGSGSTGTGTTSSPALVTSSSTAAAVNQTSSAAAAPPAKPQTFTGTGTENIGTINIPVQSTLHWSCTSCGSDNFQIFNSANDNSTIDVNGLNQTKGQTVVDAGTYHDVEINTEGEGWTLRFVPGT